ncbi:MAG: 50S ribosomal protein L29 [Candidatus Latescibacteria bacterium]|jgi:large subunit ribosomal protein L29|nr:50S ribosomal protein L29 [Candidatus Latescibacterota bacterium]
MKPHEIRMKTLEDIKNDLLAAEENLRTVRFQLVTAQLENSSLLTRAKQDVARLMTIIREQELGIRKLGEPVMVAEGEDK